jgi:hypothetical protein
MQFFNISQWKLFQSLPGISHEGLRDVCIRWKDINYWSSYILGNKIENPELGETWESYKFIMIQVLYQISKIW